MITKMLPVMFTLCLAISGCNSETPYYPLSLETLQSLTRENTSSISYEEKGEDIIVSITDKSGDSHLHKLLPESASKETLILTLQQKQAEINSPQ